MLGVTPKRNHIGLHDKFAIFLQNWESRKSQKDEQKMLMYVNEMYAEEILCLFT